MIAPEALLAGQSTYNLRQNPGWGGRCIGREHRDEVLATQGDTQGDTQGEIALHPAERNYSSEREILLSSIAGFEAVGTAEAVVDGRRCKH